MNNMYKNKMCHLNIILDYLTYLSNNGLWIMVFNATFNNISSVISWRSVLLVEETRVPGENQLPAASHSQNFIT
jgi:hypothetical protein